MFQRQLMAKLFQATVGDAISLLLRSELRNFAIADLEWLLLPPLIERQIIFKYDQPEESGSRNRETSSEQAVKSPSVPVGMLAWAMVSSEVEAKLDAQRGTGTPCRLDRADWKSGTIPRVIYAIGDNSTIEYLKAQYAQKVNAIRGSSDPKWPSSLDETQANSKALG